MEQTLGPITIDRLVTEAERRGYKAGSRLIRDWSAAGLLDYPERRGAGKGHGSRAALYSENQTELLMTLLHHRPTNGIKSLARIPVGIWLYFGDAYVPLAQVRRAMTTWLGDPRSSLREAREAAAEMLRRLDNPHATDTARNVLLTTLSEIAHTGRLDSARLERAVRDVFEPGSSQIRRGVGHPDAPLMVTMRPGSLTSYLGTALRQRRPAVARWSLHAEPARDRRKAARRSVPVARVRCRQWMGQ